MGCILMVSLELDRVGYVGKEETLKKAFIPILPRKIIT